MPAVVDDLVTRVKRRLAAEALRDLADDDLLDRFVRGDDQAAFATLVERHAPLVLSVCRRLLGPSPDAEDAFQATFLVLARRAKELAWGPCIRGWLYQVALQVAPRARQQAARRRDHEAAAARPEAVPAGHDLSWQDGLARIDDELASLPENYRNVVLACCVEGKSRDEAAAELGLSGGQVKGLLERARELLRRRLARRGVVLPAAVLLLLLQAGTAQAASAPLVSAAVHAGLAFAVGQGQAVAPAVLTLAQGVLSAMTLIRSLYTAGLAVVLTLATAVGLWASAAAPAPLTTVVFEDPASLTAFEEGKEGVKVAAVKGVLAAVDAAKNTVTIDIPAVKKEGVEAKPAEKLTLAVAPDATILSGGKPAKLADLKVGDPIVAKLSEDKKTALALSAGAAAPEKKPDGEKGAPVLRGTLKAVDAAKRTITLTVTTKAKEGEKPAEEDRTFAVAPDAKLVVTGKLVVVGKAAELTDFKAGYFVTARLSEDEKAVVALMAGEGEKKPDAEKGAFLKGKVKAVDAEKRTLTLTVAKKVKEGEAAAEEDRTFAVAPEAKIVVSGKAAELKDIKAGEAAAIKLGDDQKTVLAIQVGEGEKKPDAEKGAFLKGKVKAIDAEKKTLTLTVTKKSGDEDQTLPVAPDAKIAVNGKAGELKEIKAGDVVAVRLSEDQKTVVAIQMGEGEKKPEKK